MLDSVMTDVLEIQAIDQAQLASKWKSLVVKSADDADKIDPRTLATQLQAMGKTVEQLRAGVDKYQERQRLAALVIAGEGESLNISRSLVAKSECEAAWKIAEGEHRATLNRFDVSGMMASRANQDMIRSLRTLLLTCSPDAKRMYDGLNQRLTAPRGRLQILVPQMDTTEKQLRQLYLGEEQGPDARAEVEEQKQTLGTLMTEQNRERTLLEDEIRGVLDEITALLITEGIGE